MTNWDKIYKAFNKKGKDWEDVSDGVIPQCFINGINPLFIDFINKKNFKTKYAFDIGCGNGKYLNYLSSLGFKTDGIDFSQTSVNMTKKTLGKRAGKIKKANMFKMEIDSNKYDLIISISTINHGFKKDLTKLINHIYDALLDDGSVYITIPDTKCLNTWNTFKKFKKIDENTVTPLIGPEKDIPHSFYNKKEIEKMFKKFKHLKTPKDETGQWAITASK